VDRNILHSRPSQGKSPRLIVGESVPMADDERHLLEIEHHLLGWLGGDSRLLQHAVSHKLTPACFRNPHCADRYRGIIERPVEPPPTITLSGTTKFVGWAKELVAAHPKRPPWVEPAPAEQHVKHHANIKPKPALPITTTRTPKITAKPGNGKRQAIAKDAPPEKRQPKEMPREILWLNQVLLDIEQGEKPAMPTNCFRVAYVISQLCSPRTDDAWPSQSTIAENPQAGLNHRQPPD
jgi:hypothetical protein